MVESLKAGVGVAWALVFAAISAIIGALVGAIVGGFLGALLPLVVLGILAYVVLRLLGLH